ncbi:MAG: hypothetical protein REI45_14115, partial [Propionicimonas sp.]|nr:hypothetical protein [Propionicimonas sp.]
LAASMVTLATAVTLLQLLVAVQGAVEAAEIASVLSGTVTDLLIAVVGTVALWALALPAPVAAPGSRRAVVDEVPAVAGPESAPAPVWGRDDAVGAAWRTADEAAAGAPGSASFPAEPPDEADAWRPPSG